MGYRVSKATQMVNPAKTMGLDGSRQETVGKAVGSWQWAVRIHYIIVIFHSYGQNLRTKDFQPLTAHCVMFTVR